MARLTKQQILARNPVTRAVGQLTMPKKMWTDISMAAHISLDAVMAGTAETEHRDALAEVVNTMLLLTKHHCTPESRQEVLAARDAMFRADERAKKGHKWLLDGEGIRAMKNAVNGQDDLTAQLGQADVVAAILEAKVRLDGQMKEKEHA